MLTSIRKSDSVKVLARDADKRNGPFICPLCGSETFVRKGRIRIPHFAHKPPILCEYGKGESDYHRKCKQGIFDELSKFSDLYCELEKNLGNVIPDVYIESLRTHNKYAIEVQISNLTMGRIIERTQEYERLGIYVLWLPVYTDKLKAEKYSPKAWEKWLHAVYYGRIYYWSEGTSVVPIHFSEHRLYVGESTWYSDDGESMSAGGYYKKSRRFRTPEVGQPLDIARSFRPKERSEWKGGNIFVPKCRILIDDLKPWWNNKES